MIAPARPRGLGRRLRHRVLTAIALAGVALTGGDGAPIASALAAFTSHAPTDALTVGSILPEPPSMVTVATCGETVSGALDEQVTLSWMVPGTSDLTAYVILVGGVQVATLAPSQTSWTDGALLSVGSLLFTVRAQYGTGGFWHADSSPVSVTFQTPGTLC